MRKILVSAAIALLALQLSACGGGKKERSQQAGNAEGEILPRSVTDDMLPYGNLQSQSPLAMPKDEKTSPTAKKAEDGGENAASGDAAKSGEAEAPAAAEESPSAIRPDAE